MEYGLLAQLTLLLMLLGVVAYFQAVAAFRKATGGMMKAEEEELGGDTGVDLTTVPGGGVALLHPPALDLALLQMRAIAPRDRYRLPLGWYQAFDGARVAFTTLVRGMNHLAITGQSDSGKDNAALVMLLALALEHPPMSLQLCLIDGKGLDFAPFAHKAHTWRLAQRASEIAPTLRALTFERERRADVLRAAGVAKWDEYVGGDLPLLVVYVSELSLLQDAVGARELESWLNSELAAGRAFGMRYLVATQTLSNFGTRWRSQVGLFLAGYQPSASQDQPNSGLTTTELKAAGGVPPSELPPTSAAAGVFTAVEGRQAVTVRLPYLDTTERRAWLARLPDRPRSTATNGEALPETLPVVLRGATTAPERPVAALQVKAGVTADIGLGGAHAPPDELGSGSAVAVTDEERATILGARDALAVEMAAAGEQPSRRAICRRAFNGATGGAAFRKVQTVLDQESNTLLTRVQTGDS